MPSDVAGDVTDPAGAAPAATAEAAGPAPAPEAPSLQVRVVHGSLEHAVEPVAVGHYQGMPLTGAEGFLNDRLDGLLGDRLLLGLYAEQEGSAVLVGPLPGAAPPGALVLGLGPAGEVTTGELSRAMTQAALLRALAAAEEAGAPAAGPTTIGISTVLVGTNPLDGMTISASAAALIEGVVTAIQLLGSTPRLSSKVRIGSLEIVERYEQRALAAQRAVAALATLPAPQGTEVDVRVAGDGGARRDADVRVVVDEAVVPGRGGEPGQPQEDYNEEAWLRVDIRSLKPPPDALAGCRYVEFTSMGRRARANRLVQRIETSLVNDLIARAVGDARPDVQTCNTLYELLVPNELKYELLNADNLHLLLDHDTACYPWEALAPRYTGGNKPLALRTGVLRQFAEPETRMARFSVRPASGRHVLVIGNPPAGDHYAPLPGAAVEARQVATFFDPEGAGAMPEAFRHRVHALIWDEEGVPESTDLPLVNDAQSWLHIVNALYRHEYRIIHIAAHGRFNADEPLRSGVVIGPQDQFLTALTVSQLPVVPELVFLNCCHAGRTGDVAASADPDRNANLLAASVARSLMDVGVRAVIAAGWAVEDEPAALFATTFYTWAVEKGAAFGEAVRRTRELVRKESDSLTWAAYQCYGDPEFRLQAATEL